ncbi:MAG: hypothetical protein AB1599_10965 [Planctomycetota bacterium]
MDKTDSIIAIVCGILLIVISRGIAEFQAYMWEVSIAPRMDKQKLIKANQFVIIIVSIFMFIWGILSLFSV